VTTCVTATLISFFVFIVIDLVCHVYTHNVKAASLERLYVLVDITTRFSIMDLSPYGYDDVAAYAA